MNKLILAVALVMAFSAASLGQIWQGNPIPTVATVINSDAPSTQANNDQLAKNCGFETWETFNAATPHGYAPPPLVPSWPNPDPEAHSAAKVSEPFDSFTSSFQWTYITVHADCDKLGLVSDDVITIAWPYQRMDVYVNVHK